jgi:predicted  nucleic acid-binding Zn-ribbon protein
MILQTILCWISGCHFKFVRNIYGDEINHLNARSVWKCLYCGKYQLRSKLNSKSDL